MRNPYAMDPNLAQGFSNLSRALIGSAQDDAQMANAEAARARAGLYGSQAELANAQADQQRYLTTLGEQFYDNLDNALADDMVLGHFAKAMGLDIPEAPVAPTPVPFNVSQEITNMPGLNNPSRTPVPENLSFDDAVAAYPGLAEALIGLRADNQQQNTDLQSEFAANQDAYNQTRNAVQSLATTLYGAGLPTSEGATGVMESLQQMGTQQTIQNLITSGDPEKMRMGYILAGQSPGEYFDSGFAQEKARNVNETDISVANIQAAADQYDTDQTVAQRDRELEAQIKNSLVLQELQNNQSDRENIRDNETKLAYENYRTETENELQRWQHENQAVELSVTQGKRVIVDAATGKRIGLEPNDNGLYIIDGGEDPSKLLVKVGEEDVYLTEQQANALGIEEDPNTPGVYMIPGRPNPGSKNSSQQSFEDFDSFWQNTMTEFVPERGEGEAPNPLGPEVYGGMKVIAKELLNERVGSDQSSGRVADVMNNLVTGMISQGAIPVYRMQDARMPWNRNYAVPAENAQGEPLFIPKWFQDYYLNMSNDEWQASITNPQGSSGGSRFSKHFKQMGYRTGESSELGRRVIDAPEVQAIFNYIQLLRNQ